MNNKKKKMFKSIPSADKDDDDDDSYIGAKKWYEEIADDPKNVENVSEQLLIELKEEAKKCHDSEVANYNIKNGKTNQKYQWIRTAMSKGTASDKIAAYTVAIQDNPVYNLDKIKNLINLVKAGKKKECVQVTDTLTELFLNDLLRPNKKLKSFEQRPLSELNNICSGNAVKRRKLLSIWYFEDELKAIYENFINALNKLSHDSIENNKEKAISSMYKLLEGNPEQEKILLNFIVNKLGDPSQKVATKSIYCLSQLLFKHSNMQLVVLNEVEKFLFRPNISNKAQYYSLCFLTQFYLNHDQHLIARRLIQLYFSFFKASIKKGEVDSRMMSALLMGVNRAYPYSNFETNQQMSEHIDTLYRVVHVATFNISLHALTLLYQVSDFNKMISDRFYTALYRKLADSRLLNTTHQTMLLSLIYKALLNDTQTRRTQTFIKRLLQIALYTPQPSFTCAILYLISQLISKKENLKSFISLNYDESSSLNNANQENTKKYFDRFARNPLYAGGEYSDYSELVLLKNHFHPTVSLYASNIIDGERVQYSGDPLKDFTLIRFLDRFVFKNPKIVDEIKGAHPTFGKRKIHQPVGLKSIPINSNGYINQDQNKIPVDELFLHIYLQKKYKGEIIKNDDDDDSDLESVQSDEFNEMLDKMIVSKKKKHNQSDDYDDDDNDDYETLDYMNEIGDSLSLKNLSEKQKTEVDEELEEDEDDDLEPNEEDEELFKDDEDDDYEEEDLVFDSDSSGDEEPVKKKKKKTKGLESLFASADEFASILEDEGSSVSRRPGGINDFANKDNASAKQINWEKNRNWRLKGGKKKLSGKRKHF